MEKVATPSLEVFPSPKDLWSKYRAWKEHSPDEEAIVLQDYFDDDSGKALRCCQTNAINATPAERAQTSIHSPAARMRTRARVTAVRGDVRRLATIAPGTRKRPTLWQCREWTLIAMNLRFR